MAKSKAMIGEVLDKGVGVSEDEQLATTAGAAIREFLKGVAGFFTTAQALERDARMTLTKAKDLKAPTSGDEDAKVQDLVREANLQKRTIEDHWKITSVVHVFHKRLVAARTRGTDCADEAATIGNLLHSTYKEAEVRRAREEEDRLRREAEEKARQARQRELDDLERAAVKAEESSPHLSDREEVFVGLFLGDPDRGGDQRFAGNAQGAAAAVGFKDGIAAAARLMSSPKIQKAIKARQDADALRRQAEAKKAMPVEVEHQAVTPDVQRGGDRTTWTGEIRDGQAFIDAVFEGRHGIPRDVLRIDEVKLNEYARSMHELMDRWPGVRAKKNTKVV